MLDEKHCSSWGCLCRREKLEAQGGKFFHNAWSMKIIAQLEELVGALIWKERVISGCFGSWEL